MEKESNYSINLDSSDSDDEANAQGFLDIFSKRSQHDQTAGEVSKEKSGESVNRLDALLSEHAVHKAERERLDKVQEEMQQYLNNESQNEELSESQSLAPEHTDFLELFDVTSSKPHILPGIKLFNPDKMCCLYAETTSPFNCGFTSSGSAIDKIIAGTTPGSLTNLLLSKALVTCSSQISDKSSVLNWLLNILAVHQSPIIAVSCYNNIIGILHEFKVRSFQNKDGSVCTSWCPHPLALVRIFVNLGAESHQLLGGHSPYSHEEIRKYLSIEHDENNSRHTVGSKAISQENVRLLLKVIAIALQIQSHLSKEDLNQIFYILAKVELETCFIKNFVSLETQQCFSSILQAYSDTDWPAVVPSLCVQLHEASAHHHNQLHLAGLLPATPRGSFLQIRLSYISLRSMLVPSQPGVEEEDILNYKLADIINLCCNNEQPAVSPLKVALQELLAEDLYKMTTAIRLLDLCVGDDLYRSSQPSKTLEYLINQVNLITRLIKDNVSSVDQCKIKDSLSKLQVKWSLSLQEHQNSRQRSILPWISSSNTEVVTQEELRDNCSQIMDDLDLDLND